MQIRIKKQNKTIVKTKRYNQVDYFKNNFNQLIENMAIFNQNLQL